jgi:hypothetical protein
MHAAKRARRLHRSSEILIIVLSATVTLSPAMLPNYPLVPAVLGSLVVVTAGLRAVFHWGENYIRFSQAREAVEAERRLYRTGAEPYHEDASRHQVLAKAITRIEQDEIGKWAGLASRSKQ